MADYSALKATIDASINTNGQQAITGAILNDVLNEMVDVLGEGYTFLGVATPTTNPTTPEGKAYYLAGAAGTYRNFGNIVVASDEVALLVWGGTAWSKVVSPAASKEEVSQLGQELGDLVDYTSALVVGKYYISNAIGQVPEETTSANWKYCIIPVLAGEQYSITGKGGANPTLWALTDTDRKVLSYSQTGYVTSDVTDTCIVTEDGYLYVNMQTSTTNPSVVRTRGGLIGKVEDEVELHGATIRAINKKIYGTEVVSDTTTASANTNLNKFVNFAVPAGDWTILTHADFGEGKAGTITFRDAANTAILSTGITFGTPLVVTLPSAAAKALVYMPAARVGDGGSLYLTAEQYGIVDDIGEISEEFEDTAKTLSSMATDNLFIPTAGTQTIQGVTCTLSDGIYLLNGTASGYGYIWLTPSSKISVKQGEKYAILGKNVNSARYSLAYRLYKNGTQVGVNAINDNSVLTIGDADQLELGVNVINGVTYNNAEVDIIAVSAYSAVYPLYMQTIAEIKKKPRPLLTIIDDDGFKKFHTLLLPLIVSKNVPISTAIVGQTISVEDYAMTWDEVKECAEAGAEILSHTYSHLSAGEAETMTQPEIQTDYQKMQNILRLHGYDGSILVFAGDSSNMAKCVNACKYVCSCGIKAGTNKTNYVDTINRYGIDRWNVLPSTTDMQTLLDTLASAGTGWMVWMIHTSDVAFQSDSVTALGNAIDYARTLGIDIVNVAAGVAYYLDGRD